MAQLFASLEDPELHRLIASGAVGVLPTDTVYGLVTPTTDQGAVKRLYEIKKRDKKPGTLIAANVQQLEELGFKHRYLKAVEGYWPGAISVVLPCSPELAYLHQGKMSLAVRVPADPRLHALLEQTGSLLTSSANQPGEPPSSTMAEARECFGEAVDYYVNGGDLSGREASTIIRIIDDAIEVIREGAVKIDENGRIA